MSGGCLASFYADIGDLDKVNWSAVAATDFRDIQVKEGKQAEFLFYESFPWSLVEKIGVIDNNTVQTVQQMLEEAQHKPLVSVEQSWYF